jgi:hypothetical protein
LSVKVRQLTIAMKQKAPLTFVNGASKRVNSFII